jgi:hypothetical protein
MSAKETVKKLGLKVEVIKVGVNFMDNVSYYKLAASII